MAGAHEILREEWDNMNGPLVLSTVNAHGMPNSIYATCVKLLDDGRIVVADNYFNKTRANIRAGSKGAILFITQAGKAFQAKGKIDYIVAGPVYDEMRQWVDQNHPRIAAATMTVEELYSGGERLA